MTTFENISNLIIQLLQIDFISLDLDFNSIINWYRNKWMMQRLINFDCIIILWLYNQKPLIMQIMSLKNHSTPCVY